MDGSPRIQPEFKIPQCYIMQLSLMPHMTSHLSKYTEETLFYIFYSMPKDLMQMYAAKQLISKNWKYHKDLKLWFQQVGDLIAKTNTYERGSYIYFDVNSWKKVQKDDFVLEYELIFPPLIQQTQQQQMGSM
jgi:CCR4-NOT transcription complex subunit 2